MDNLFSFLDDTLSVSEVVSAYNIYASDEYLESLYDIEEIDDICGHYSVTEIAGMVINGNFSLNSEYFTFDGYGNFESVDENEALEYIENNVDGDEEAFYTKLIEYGYIDCEEYDEWKQENE